MTTHNEVSSITELSAMPDLLREIVAYCREAGHDWSSLTEAEHMLTTLQAQQSTQGDAQAFVTPAEVSDEELRKTVDALRDPFTVSAFYNGYYTLTPDELRRAILALRPQSESEQEKELRRSLTEAQATISERNAEIIELQKRIRRSQQAVVAKAQVPTTLKDFAKLAGVTVLRCGNEWGGTWAYKTADSPYSTFAGYRTEEALYRAWAEDTFGKVAAKALAKLLAAHQATRE